MKSRIELLINYFGWTQSEFAKKIRIAPSAIIEWISRNSIPSEDIQHIKEVCENVDVNWLLTGEGTLFKEPTHTDNVSQWAVTPTNFTPNVQYNKGKKNVTIECERFAPHSIWLFK